MTLKKCSAKDCAASAHLYPDLPMFKFPRDLDRCRIWVRNAGNDKLLQSPSRRLSVRRYLCANHFEENEFFDKFRRRLRRTAVPTLFSCTPLSEEIMLKFPILDDKNSEGPYSNVKWPSSSCQYNTFPFPSVKGADKSSPISFHEDNDSDTVLSSLKIPYFLTTKDLKSIVPGPVSISYIEGPWCKSIKTDESVSVEIVDKLNSKEEQCQNESPHEMEEVILHDEVETLSLELPAQQFFDNSVQERQDIDDHHDNINNTGSFELHSKLPPYPSFMKNIFCTEDVLLIDASKLSKQSHPDTDNFLSLPTQEKNFVIQNKQLSSGAEVHVMYKMPQAAVSCTVHL